ncbi:MAG: glycoside hydrolase family protein [Neomegalonema sp.]
MLRLAGLTLMVIAGLCGCASTQNSNALGNSYTAPSRFAGPNPAPAAVAASFSTPQPELESDGQPFEPGDPALQVTDYIVEMIKTTSGFRAEPEFTDMGLWVIGYGSLSAVRPEATVTEEAAEERLREELVKVGNGIRGMLETVVLRREFSAMVALARDIGTAAFETSGVLRRFNAGDRAAAAEAFLLWKRTLVDGERVEDPVLSQRREADRAHFLGLPPPEPKAPGGG